MDLKSSDVQWLCIGKSVQGSSHLKSQLPNQDAIDWILGTLPQDHEGPPVILAVSDGHGSAKSFRSDRGSKFAVESTIKVLKDFFLGNQAENNVNIATLKDITQNLLPKLISDEWIKQVQSDLHKEPISQKEKEVLLEKSDQGALESIENNPLLVYGATLLATLVTELYIVYIQLGDGDIFTVDASGHSNRPLPKDERLIANETTSLCSPKAWNEFNIHVDWFLEKSTKELPVLIFLSTDGYSNSFLTDDEFFKIGKDYLEIIRDKGIYNLERQLKDFLEQTSEKGSGDDITLGIIKRIESEDRDYLVGVTSNIQKKTEILEKTMNQNLDNYSNLEKK